MGRRGSRLLGCQLLRQLLRQSGLCCLTPGVRAGPSDKTRLSAVSRSVCPPRRPLLCSVDRAAGQSGPQLSVDVVSTPGAIQLESAGVCRTGVGAPDRACRRSAVSLSSWPGPPRDLSVGDECASSSGLGWRRFRVLFVCACFCDERYTDVVWFLMAPPLFRIMIQKGVQ